MPNPEVRTCDFCRTPLERKRCGRKLESPERFAARRFCDPVCHNKQRAALRHTAAQVCERPGCEVSLAGMRARSRYCSRSCAVRTRNGSNPARGGGRPRNAAKVRKVQKPVSTPQGPLKANTQTHYGLGPLQPFALNSPNPKRHDLMAERESGVTRPEPSDGEIMALLKVCLELHEPLLECWEEGAQAASPVRRVPRAAAGRARWQA